MSRAFRPIGNRRPHARFGDEPGYDEWIYDTSQIVMPRLDRGIHVVLDYPDKPGNDELF